MEKGLTVIGDTIRTCDIRSTESIKSTLYSIHMN